ncbi:uncharacterized protein LOC123429272 [Hordeum vulgare subsp. vulgare]|uniref:F-box domain-containing protein n=1 Tax=Hordeum vulgare subsp. vulgare TaxID=112509 RepID=A0A8I6X186_HORVV|nr:uncharacterized protein LOC123429272 [Hordeum vulgare subsp. vulgare]
MKNRNGRRCRSRNKATCDEAPAGSGDRISKLPSDILLNILERLDTLDAIRACILSKQMLKLPTLLSQLVINIGSIGRHLDESYDFGIRDMVRINCAVADVTEKIMVARDKEIPIRKLTVRFYLMRYNCLSIGTSVAGAMATQKVEAAEFEILTEKAGVNCTPGDFLGFAKQFNIFLGACPHAFAGLTRLRLHCMRFGEPDIPNILTICKWLQSLRLSYCDAGIGSVLQVEHARLVELAIDYGRFETVELSCAPKLERMSYNNWNSDGDPLSFGFVPRLSKLDLTKVGTRSHKTLELGQLLANAPNISDLHLDFESEKIWILPERPILLTPLLGKLRVVNLDNLPEGCEIAWTMFILEAAPFLEDLCITVWDHWCNMLTDKKLRKAHGYCEKENVEWKPSVSGFKHKNLAKLTIYGFQPDFNFIGYINRIVKAAVNLKEISLHDRKLCNSCGNLDPKIKVSPSKYPRTQEEREHITEVLSLASSEMVFFWS